MLKTKKFKFDNYSGMYRGVVLSNLDPLLLGRTKINIHGVFDGISSDSLPWAVPAMPLFVGSGSGQGCFCVPDVGTYVWCFFETGDFFQPVYFAEASSGVHGLPTERTTNYPFRRVWKTKNDISVVIDDSAEEVQINHSSGSQIKMEQDGTIVITGTKVKINPS